MPNTHEAAKVLKRLDRAARIDKHNAHGWTTKFSDVGHFSYHKYKETTALAKKLRAGEPISSADVDQALGDRGAPRLGGY